MPKLKPYKLWVLILVAIFFLTAAGGCAHNDSIVGHYVFEQTIYKNSASSYFATKDNADEYIITDNSLIVIHTDGTRTQIPADFHKSKIEIEQYTALFKPPIGVPDISMFKERYQYSINDQYRLYVMDDTVWIAQCPSEIMWSIYRVVKIQD
ncbi:MAG: hypothetical protein PHE50_05335 [Dehalococcoidales bacterium]|nr:hypothetical protein [Dehalococcoidales bacterium]